MKALQTKPRPGYRKASLALFESMSLPKGSTAVLLSDGVEDGSGAALAGYLTGHGTLRYIAAGETDAPRLVAAGGDLAGKDFSVSVRSLSVSAPRGMTLRASAEDGALLAREPASIAPGEANAGVRLAMPPELRNRIARIEIEGEESAGAVLLVDERWRRRPVGIAAAPNLAGQPLLSENYYLERALGPSTEVRRGST